MVELAFPGGSRPGSLSSGGCVVVGELWPAWLPTATAVAGHLRLHVFTSLPLEAALEEGAVTVGGWYKESMWEDLKLLAPQAKMFLVSGSVAFVERFLGIVGDVDVMIALDCGEAPSRSLCSSISSWSKIKHAEVGGATTALAWLGSTATDHVVKTFDPVRRNLRDFLSPMEEGKMFDVGVITLGGKSRKVERLSGGVIHPGGLLPWTGVLKARVAAPSIFSSTKWVVRKLTTTEIFGIWDFPQGDSTLTEALMHPKNLGFLTKAPPTKILWHFAATSPVFGILVRTLPSQVEETGKGIPVADRVFGLTPIGEEEDELLQAGYLKAVRADDAEVDVSLWDKFLCRGLELEYTPKIASALVSIRKLALLRWKLNLLRSFGRYRVSVYGNVHPAKSKEGRKDQAAAREALIYASKSSFWEWDGGSALFFWRWPAEVRRMVRDGVRSFIQTPLPVSTRSRARREKDPKVAKQVAAKLLKVVKRGYIVPCEVVNYTDYFSVAKGEDDIRMVYNGTSSGVNDAIWAPKTGVPSPESAMNQWDEHTMSGDSDQGDMFLNHRCDQRLCKYFGVDLSPYAEELGMTQEEAKNQAWSRQFMGKTDSPYGAVKTVLFSEEVVKGDRHDPLNPFRWDEVQLNLPGTPEYDARKSWVARFRKGRGVWILANDTITYVDDDRGLGNGHDEAEAEEACWAVLIRSAKLRAYLGIQDAARKRRPPVINAGAWAGTVFRRTDKGLGKAVTQEKWEKHRRTLQEIRRAYTEGRGWMDFKDLERHVGYLTHMSRTYELFKPFLKGLSLTLNSWRPDRDRGGWKDKSKKVKYDFTTPPQSVQAVPRFENDLCVLEKLSARIRAPVHLVRPRHCVVVRYGFGDASGSGFATSVSTSVGGQEGIRLRVGVWGSDMETLHSSYTEMRNWVEALEREGADGLLEGVEIFVFTDNSTLEAAFYSGSSTTSTLFSLVVRLYLVQDLYGCRLHIVHCSGKRQIKQGMDGGSRGDLTEGVLRGDPMLSFVPLHVTAFEYEKTESLLEWIRWWSGEASLAALHPSEWYSYAHGIRGGRPNLDGIWMPTIVIGQTYLWAPPPCIAREAVAELRKARHKRPSETHIFVVPRIMGYAWRKQLEKEADLVLIVRAGSLPCWARDNCESLLIVVCLPFIRTAPWKLGGTPRLLADERRMRSMLKTDHSDPGIVLRKLCMLPAKLDRMSPSLVRRVLFYGQPPGLPDPGTA